MVQIKYIPEQELYEVVFDQTCGYPKGGGQLPDFAAVSNDSFEGKIINIFYNPENSKEIVHQIRIIKGALQIDEIYNMEIDIERRTLNSKIHSAGHVIDEAMVKINELSLKPSNACHYPEMSFVCYKSEQKLDCQKLLQDLQSKVNELIELDLKIRIEFENDEEFCMRYCVIGDQQRVPCGGTHVESLKKIGKINITKIVQKKDDLKVSYKIEQ